MKAVFVELPPVLAFPSRLSRRRCIPSAATDAPERSRIRQGDWGHRRSAEDAISRWPTSERKAWRPSDHLLFLASGCTVLAIHYFEADDLTSAERATLKNLLIS